MSVPSMAWYTVEQARREREEIVKEMAPYDVAILRRLRDAGAIEFKEEELLDRYETLSWLISE